MTRRGAQRLGAVWAAWSIAVSVQGCRTEVERQPRPLTVRTDLANLRAIINLPPGDFPCRWVTAPVGSGGGSRVPGPTDTRTHAFVALDALAWSQLMPAGSRTASQTVTLAASVARGILPPASFAGARQDEGRVTIAGTTVPAESLGRSPHRISFAIKVADGLLVGTFTM